LPVYVGLELVGDPKKRREIEDILDQSTEESLGVIADQIVTGDVWLCALSFIMTRKISSRF
jgi:hypothetical protein